MKSLQAIAASAILGVSAVFAPGASAADVGVSLGVSAPYTLDNQPVYVTQPVYVSEPIYTSQPIYSTQPVYSDGYESVWVEPVYRDNVIITQGYYNRRPYARYHRPSMGFGFGFNFGNFSNSGRNDRNHGHHDGRRDKPGRYR